MALILVVEGGHHLRSTIAEILTLHGHEVLQARSGDEAVERCIKRSVDLAITDLVIRGIDAIRLIPTLRQEHRDLPIIVMSARFTRALRKTVTLLGAVATLEKPFSKKDLLAMVDKVLGKQPEG